MEELKGIPEWLGAAVIGAVLAALGYVAKLIAEWIAEINERRRSRRADLVELYSLLRAGRVAFTVQGGHRDTLFGLIRNRDPELVGLASQEGYDHVFAMAYSDMLSSARLPEGRLAELNG